MSLPLSQIWVPDLYVINTADSNGFLQYNSNYVVYVFYHGLIYMNIALIGKVFSKIKFKLNFNFDQTGLNTRCSMNIYTFPYDQQICSIVIGSWFQDQVNKKFKFKTI